MTKYVGLVWYRDMLLALTEDGRLYQIEFDDLTKRVSTIQLLDRLPKELDYDL